MKFHRDCRSFPGTYACEIMTSEHYESCEGCSFYEPTGKKILILKLGALGDVLRTTTILPSLKERYGNTCAITWVVSAEGVALLQGNPLIDRILPNSPETAMRLQYETFDVLLSLEVAPPATVLARSVKALEKYGFFYGDDGHPSCFTSHGEPYLRTVFSNQVNFKTRMTHQEMLFGICNLPFRKECYQLQVSEEERVYGKKIVSNVKKKLIGITLGAGGRWLSKSWHPSEIIALVEMIQKKKEYAVILLGGELEEEQKKFLVKELSKKRISVLTNDGKNNLREFIGVLSMCDIVVSNDTLALHLALALKKRTIGLFFCTPYWQIETYNGLMTPVVSPLLEKYFMDDQYHEELVKSIPAKKVFDLL